MRSAQELVMNAGAGPTLERPGAPSAARMSSPNSQGSQALRLPEERAFEVGTINNRLASMAREAAPRLKS